MIVSSRQTHKLSCIFWGLCRNGSNLAGTKVWGLAARIVLKCQSVRFTETTVGDLYRFFAADDFDAYPIVQDGMLVGIVSKLDALEVFDFTEDQILPRYADGMGTQVNEIMSSDVVVVDPETKLQRVLQMLAKHKVKSLPIIDQRRNLVGIIAREDVMRAMERWALRQ